MEYVLEFTRKFLLEGWFPVEYILCTCLLLLPLRKREGFALPLALFPVVVLLLDALKYLSVPEPVVLVLLIAVVHGVFLLCTRLDGWDAVYGAACAYAVQHLSYTVHSLLTLAFGWIPYLPVFLAAVYLCYRLFVKNMVLDGAFRVGRRTALMSAVSIYLFVFFLSSQAENYYHADVSGNQPLFLISRVYAALCCLFVLYVQISLHREMQTQNELYTQRVLWQKQKEQYELSRETIDHINRKCHDLKHQIAALRSVPSGEERGRYLDEIEQSVMIYDAAVKTGNEVLDTLLTEKSLICEREGITWTCVADGEKLTFLDPVDLYTLFGNALDNAIECVRKLSDPERRVIALTVYERPQLSVIQVENFYEGELSFRDGLPVTSKENREEHGFGMRSIRALAEKYGGAISIDTEDSIFLLSITLPHTAAVS